MFNFRGCGGIFCEKCLQNTITVNGEANPACGGCFRGETPGENIKRLAMSLLTEELPFSQPVYYQLNNNVSTVSDNAPAPPAGYFELVNKMENAFICVKLFSGGNFVNELSKTGYKPVGPLETIRGEFNPHIAAVTLIVLTDNPNPLPSDGRVITSSKGMYKASACVATENFRHVVVFNLPSQAKNILLKYKPVTGLELRVGSSVKRLGLLGALTGSKQGQGLDFNTNIDSIEFVYSSLAK